MDEACANSWLLLVVAHVLGVVISSFLQRENLARAMVTGRKRGAAEGVEPRSLRGLGITLAAAVVGFWSWNLTTATPVPGTAAATDVEGHDDDDDEEHSTLAGEHESDDD